MSSTINLLSLQTSAENNTFATVLYHGNTPSARIGVFFVQNFKKEDKQRYE